MKNFSSKKSSFSVTDLTDLAIYEQLWVGLSGGLDSTVLLHYLATYTPFTSKLHVVHVHHGLSPNADAWVEHCQEMCQILSIPCHIKYVQLTTSANLEQAARHARYKAYAEVMQSTDCILLGHHADDQAETVLLNLCRGAGINGLAAMPMRKSLVQGCAYRPFLHVTRQQLEAYAREHHLKWIEDESNQNPDFARNFVRHQVLPLLQQQWSGVKHAMARHAQHNQEALENLEALARMDYPCLEQQGNELDLILLSDLSSVRVRNVLQFWFKYNQILPPSEKIFIRIMTEIMHSAMDAKSEVNWHDVSLRRYRQRLYLLSRKMAQPAEQLWKNFPAPFPLDETTQLCAQPADLGISIPPNARVSIRYRQGGEVIRWHKQTKSLKKLWQAWGVPPWQRDKVPLLYVNDRLAMVVGYVISDEFLERKLNYVYKVTKKTL